MVAETYHDNEKGKVQGFHDFVLFGLVAFASLMSGNVQRLGLGHAHLGGLPRRHHLPSRTDRALVHSRRRALA